MKEVVGADITFTVKEMDEGYDIPVAPAGSKASHMDLLLRKGVYPYDYMDRFEKLQAVYFANVCSLISLIITN